MKLSSHAIVDFFFRSSLLLRVIWVKIVGSCSPRDAPRKFIFILFLGSRDYENYEGAASGTRLLASSFHSCRESVCLPLLLLLLNNNIIIIIIFFLLFHRAW